MGQAHRTRFEIPESSKQGNIARPASAARTEHLGPLARIGSIFLSGLILPGVLIFGAFLSPQISAQQSPTPNAWREPTDAFRQRARRLSNASVQRLRTLQLSRGMSQEALFSLTPEQFKKLALRLKYPDLPDRRASFYLLRRGYFTSYVPSHTRVAASQRHRELRLAAKSAPESKKKLLTYARVQGQQWQLLGPSRVGGRTRALVFDPKDPNKLWAGSVAGGIWVRNLAGGGWKPVADFMANLAVSCLAIDPTSPNIMYAGTGEGFNNGDAIPGAGVFYSKDGGNTWKQLPSTLGPEFQYITRLAVSPDGETLLAATTTGLYRSVESDHSPENRIVWERRSDVPMADVRFHPKDGTRAIAGGLSDGNVYHSSDGGTSWAPANSLDKSAGGRVEVTYATKDPSLVVYASVDSSPSKIWRSEDGGWSFKAMKTQTLDGDDANYLGTQGWYDNTIWAGDPSDDTFVIVGGIELWRSKDGGNTLEQITKWDDDRSAHADQHVIAAHPRFGTTDGTGAVNRTVFVGNDGGVYRTPDIANVKMPKDPNTNRKPTPAEGAAQWQALNEDYSVTQFYAVAGNPATGMIVGGAQDNGTLAHNLNDPRGTEWPLLFGGDGGYCAADPGNVNLFYGEYINLDVHRMLLGGSKPVAESISGQYYDDTDQEWYWRPRPHVIPDAQNGQANFIAPLVVEPNVSSTARDDEGTVLYAGGMSLWRTRNANKPYVKGCPASGPEWGAIKPSTGSPISAITVVKKPNAPTIIWIGHNNGELYVTSNGQDTFPLWSKVSSGDMPTDRMCTRITVDPTNSDRVFVTFGGFAVDNVWLTTDGGANWKNVGGSLPPAPVYTVALHPQNRHIAYLGTEVGVFERSADDQLWSVSLEGMPDCPVADLIWINNTLVAATHGRGMFKIDQTLKEGQVRGTP